jgi:hypothetical protein
MTLISRYIIVLGLLLSSCSRTNYSQLGQYKDMDSGLPDYQKLQSWAAHPDKQDPADSIPKPLRSQWTSREVDVFFVHPTTFTDENRIQEFNARINDDTLNLKTDYSTILYQASVFNADARVWAPRYRQAHLQMYWYKDTTRALEAFDTAYQDVKRAFQYFISHNDNRPFIIASHSQGTTHAKRLIAEMVDTSVLRNRMVMAYLIGIPVAANQFRNIPVCQDSLQTGCFVSWRTYRRGVDSTGYSNDADAVVVNPLTWTTHTETGPKSLHRGAVLYNFDKLIRHPNDAQIHNNILWISRPKFFGSFLYRSKNYHAGDYNLFYMNVREDVRRRIRMFWKR